MNEIWGLLPSLLVGLVLGALFFGGLWWTVQQGLTAKRPALWFMSSMVVRAGITVGGFYIVGNHDFRRLLVCLAGFIIARLIVTRMTRISVTASGVSHAS
jgi:F1F0 ATPase subunit 2